MKDVRDLCIELRLTPEDRRVTDELTSVREDGSHETVHFLPQEFYRIWALWIFPWKEVSERQDAQGKTVFTGPVPVITNDQHGLIVSKYNDLFDSWMKPYENDNFNRYISTHSRSHRGMPRRDRPRCHHAIDREEAYQAEYKARELAIYLQKREEIQKKATPDNKILKNWGKVLDGKF